MHIPTDAELAASKAIAESLKSFLAGEAAGLRTDIASRDREVAIDDNDFGGFDASYTRGAKTRYLSTTVQDEEIVLTGYARSGDKVFPYVVEWRIRFDHQAPAAVVSAAIWAGVSR